MSEMIQQHNGIAVNMAVSRQMQEVQGAIQMAKQFPRDQIEASLRIKNMCGRMSLAKVATYAFPRSNQTIQGASIRLAEAIAQAWGNIDYGIVELSTSEGLSELMAYAWDLETNVRRSMIFSVKHERDTKYGKKTLTDNRDIYEMVANMGARRVRACILGVIPGDIVDEALAQCQETLEKGETKTLSDRLKVMLGAFKENFGITRKQIEAYAGYPIENFDRNKVREMSSIYNSLKDGAAKKEDFFTFQEAVDVLADQEEGSTNEPDSGKLLQPDGQYVLPIGESSEGVPSM